MLEAGDTKLQKMDNSTFFSYDLSVLERGMK